MSTAPSHVLAEKKLCAIACERLHADGWHVVCEVPFWERSIDIGATRGSDLLFVEAKMSFTGRLQQQIGGASFHADFALVVVSTRPRSEKLAWAEKGGVGVWRVDVVSGKIEVLVQWRRQQARAVDYYRQQKFDEVSMASECFGGGSPCLAGVGPAIVVEDAVTAYRSTHAGVTWEDVWRAVPNHYASARSMQSAFYSNRQRRAFRARQREARQAARLDASCGEADGAGATASIGEIAS